MTTTVGQSADDEESKEFHLFITNAIKADLRNISLKVDDHNHNSILAHQSSSSIKDSLLQQQQQQAIRFLSELYNSSIDLEHKIEQVIKPCIKLICGFIHNLARESLTKESIMNRLISNCKLTVYILFEIFMYSDSNIIDASTENNMQIDDEENEANDDSNRVSITSQIASYFGLYDELVAFVMAFSFHESFLEKCIAVINPSRYVNIKVEQSHQLMQSFLKRSFQWICVSSNEMEIQTQLSPLGCEVVFKHLIHSIQSLVFKCSIKNNNGSTLTGGHFSSSMKMSKYWFRMLWEHDSSLMKPLIVDLLKRMCQVMKVKRPNQYHSNLVIYLSELIQSLMVCSSATTTNENEAQVNHHSLEDFGKFILLALREIIECHVEDFEGKNQAIVMYFNFSQINDQLDDEDELQPHSDANSNNQPTMATTTLVKNLIELLLDKVLFLDKNTECRITALETIQKIVESRFFKRSQNRNALPINRIFNQIAHVLKFDPNQSVRNASFELWLSIYENSIIQDSTIPSHKNHLLIFTNMLHLKSRDKEKKIRIRVYEKISEIGISKLNHLIQQQMKSTEQQDYSEPIMASSIANNKSSLKLSRIVRNQASKNRLQLLCESIRELLIIGMLDEEKKVRDLTEQLFVDFILNGGIDNSSSDFSSAMRINLLELMNEMEESYGKIVRVVNIIGEQQHRSQRPSCWALFEGVLKGNINILYSKQ